MLGSWQCFFSHQCILQRAREAIGPFIFIGLFWCSPYGCPFLSTCTCLGFQLYFHGIVLLFAFIYMNVFGFSPLHTWTCLGVRLYPCWPVWLFTFINIDWFGCYPYWLVLLFVFIYIGMFCCSLVPTPRSTYLGQNETITGHEFSSVARLYRHEFTLPFAFMYIDLLGCSLYLHGLV